MRTASSPLSVDMDIRNVPPLSVIIPAANDPLLVESVMSLLACNEGIGAEIIIVLNGSSPEYLRETTLQLAASVGVRIIGMPMQSLPKARNFGIRHARGKKLLMFDSDCRPKFDDYLMRVCAALDAAPIVVGPVEFHALGGTRVDKAYAALRDLDYQLHQRSRLYSPNIAYRKDIIESVGLYDEQLVTGEDSDFGHRVVAAGYLPRSIKLAIVCHRQHASLRTAIATWYQYGSAKGVQLSKGPFRVQSTLRDLRYVASPLGNYFRRAGGLISTLWLRPTLACAFQAGFLVALLAALWRRK